MAVLKGVFGLLVLSTGLIVRAGAQDAVYLGCYLDTNILALPNTHMLNDLMTLQMCFIHCQAAGERYAGLQYGRNCYCGIDGVDYDRYGAANETDCSLQCYGNAEQICGGPWRSSVHDLTPGTTELPGISTIIVSTLSEDKTIPIKTTRLSDEGAIAATGLPDESRNTAIAMLTDDKITPVISLIKSNSSALVISWEQDLSAIEYYIRFYPKNDQRNIQLKHVPAAANHAELSDLDSSTVYIITIEVKNSSSLYSTLGTAEMKTLRASSSSNVETALIYISCVFAAIIVLLLIIICFISCCLNKKKQLKTENQRNGDVKFRDNSLEHHNLGYKPTKDEDEVEDKRASHTYIYISPESSPVSSPIGLFPDLNDSNV